MKPRISSSLASGGGPGGRQARRQAGPRARRPSRASSKANASCCCTSCGGARNQVGDATERRLEAAICAQIEVWAERVLSAATLAELLAD